MIATSQADLLCQQVLKTNNSKYALKSQSHNICRKAKCSLKVCIFWYFELISNQLQRFSFLFCFKLFCGINLEEYIARLKCIFIKLFSCSHFLMAVLFYMSVKIEVIPRWMFFKDLLGQDVFWRPLKYVFSTCLLTTVCYLGVVFIFSKDKNVDSLTFTDRIFTFAHTWAASEQRLRQVYRN